MASGVNAENEETHIRTYPLLILVRKMNMLITFVNFNHRSNFSSNKNCKIKLILPQ